MKGYEDVTGRRFGYLVSLGRSSRRGSKGDLPFEMVKCDCGVKKDVRRGDMIHGRVKSCGCQRISMIVENKTKHGHGQGTPTYRSWAAAIERCTNPNNKSFHRYGGRGLTVCARWQKSFANFLADMGEKPAGTHLDRRDNNGNYTPDNCRWVSPQVNGNNTSRNRKITAFGQTKTMSQWARTFGLEVGTVRRRLDSGWDIEDALISRPARTRALNIIVRMIDDNHDHSDDGLSNLIARIYAVATSKTAAIPAMDAAAKNVEGRA